MDRPSAWRLGVAAALDTARNRVWQADSVAAAGDVDVVVAVVDDSANEVPGLVREVAGAVPVVAVLTKPSIGEHADALRAGVDGVAGCDVSPRRLRSVVAAAVSGSVMLPVEVARALASDIQQSSVVVLTDPEVSWLRGLARGATVRELAAASSLPLDVMSRRLRRLYNRMGVKGRTEAVMVAGATGVIAQDPLRGQEQRG